MKKILLSLLLIPFTGSTQVITTVADGIFLNPFTWDCTCVPSDGDSLVINHDLISNTDIYYSSGRISINNGGSLVEDATDRAIWIDGGSLINRGTFTFHKLWLSNGEIENNAAGIMDSVWNQSSFVNSNNGTITVYDIINDETGDFLNSGLLDIANDMNNQGYFYNTGTIDLGNDFSNCNIQTMDAIFENLGTFCITNDFSNCPDDTLKGSGHYFIGGSSSNLGVFDGTFTFHTPSGTIGIPGNIQPGVTVTTGACNISIAKLEEDNVSIYPSPISDNLTISTPEQVDFKIFSTDGNIVFEGNTKDEKIDLQNLKAGIYLIVIDGYKTQRLVKI